MALYTYKNKQYGNFPTVLHDQNVEDCRAL